MDTIVCVVCETEFPDQIDYDEKGNYRLSEAGVAITAAKCPKCGAEHGYDEGTQVFLGPVINYDLEKGEVTFQIKRGG